MGTVFGEYMGRSSEAQCPAGAAGSGSCCREGGAGREVSWLWAGANGAGSENLEPEAPCVPQVFLWEQRGWLSAPRGAWRLMLLPLAQAVQALSRGSSSQAFLPAANPRARQPGRICPAQRPLPRTCPSPRVRLGLRGRRKRPGHTGLGGDSIIPCVIIHSGHVLEAQSPFLSEGIHHKCPMEQVVVSVTVKETQARKSGDKLLAGSQARLRIQVSTAINSDLSEITLLLCL